MAVPDFQSFMLPLLRFAADGQEHSLVQARQRLASDLELSVSDLEEILPSGSQTRFSNRLTWAKVYLAQAGLLIASRRGHFRITDRGREVLQAPPSRIDIKYLDQFPEFAEFRKGKVAPHGKTPPATPDDDGGQTPEEALEAAHVQMTASLGTEVLERVNAGASAFFERLVVELLLKMGYGGSRTDAGQAVGKSGDEGIDGVISEDRLGLDVVYLQAKKWDGTVGRPEIQKFVGALHGRRAKKGVFILNPA